MRDALRRVFSKLQPSAENLTSGLIGGVTGLIVALSVVGMHSRFSEIDAGDVLQFIGAVFGTGIAIAGAVWIEGRKRKALVADSARPVLDALLALEKKSRPFFGESKKRRLLGESIQRAKQILDRTVTLVPPRTPQLIGLFDRLEDGTELITGEAFLIMNDLAPHAFCPERHRVEELLEAFDGPLKVLIVEYSRLVDLRATRSVHHLGAMPDLER